MRIFNEFRETTNSGVYKKLRKEYYAIYSRDKWHGHNSENDPWPNYYVRIRGKRKGEGKFPNWKLVSKNKRQWMKKSVRVNRHPRYPYPWDAASIQWPDYDGHERYGYIYIY